MAECSDRTPRLVGLAPPAPSSAAAGAVDTVVFSHKVIEVDGTSRGAGASTLARLLAAEAARLGVSAIHVEPATAFLAARRGADFYLLDAGQSAVFAGLADYVVLVASARADPALDACIGARRRRLADPGLPLGLVINLAASPGEGAAAAERAARAASSVVPGPPVEVLGWVTEDRALRASCPAPGLAAGSAAGPGVRMCARRLWSGPREGWRRAVAERRVAA